MSDNPSFMPKLAIDAAEVDRFRSSIMAAIRAGDVDQFVSVIEHQSKNSTQQDLHKVLRELCDEQGHNLLMLALKCGKQEIADLIIRKRYS